MVNVAAHWFEGGGCAGWVFVMGPCCVVLAACAVVLIANFTLARGLWAPVHEKYSARLALLQMQLFHYKLLTKKLKPVATRHLLPY